MSWLSTVRELFRPAERPVDLQRVSGASDPRPAPAPAPVARTVLVDRDGVLTRETTQSAPKHLIYIDGDDRPYHHVHEHEGAWVYRRM